MSLTQQQEARLVRMKAYMKTSGLFALQHIAMATTGASKQRNVCTGDHKLTGQELVADDLNTALTHIFNVQKAADNIALLLEGREDEIQ